MTISGREAKILSAIELNADRTTTELQTLTGHHSHTVRYIIQKLERAGVIQKVPFVDMYPLGYQDFGFYFSLASLQSKAKERLLNLLKTSPLVTFLLELGGDYQYGASMYAKHVAEFTQLLDKLSIISENLFFDKSFTLRVSMTRFNRKYLSPDSPIQERSFGNTKAPAEIDQTDEAILQALTKNGGLSQRELARRLGLSFASVNSRLQTLTNKQILHGMTYEINPTKIGMQAFQLLVFAKGLSQSFQEELYLYAKRHPSMVYFVRCIGTWDFEIGVEVDKTEEITQIAQELYEKLGQHIVGIKTIPIFSILKYAFFRPSVIL
jgi:DNA-binding Lrp family transcriptional regulator